MEGKSERSKLSLERRSTMNKRMVPLAGYISELEAQVASGHLEAEGVHTDMVKDDAGGMLPSLQETERVVLFVRPKDLKRAKAILAEKQRATK